MQAPPSCAAAAEAPRLFARPASLERSAKRSSSSSAGKRAPPPSPPADGAPFAEHLRISGVQRQRLQDSILAGIGRLLDSSKTLLADASPDAPDSGGPLAVAGGLYTYALEEYGKLLLIRSLPEKGGSVSVPYREIFRSHSKKFRAALDALPYECRLLGGGIFDPRIFDPRIFDTDVLEATFSARASQFYTDIDRGGEPAASRRPRAKTLEKAPRGLERAAAEWEAP